MPKLCLVGIDGLRFDRAAEEGAAPTLQRLARDGSLTTVWMQPPTLSGPGWSTILTGRPPSVTNVYDNTFAGNRLGNCPDLLSQIWFADNDANTFAAVSWPELADPHHQGPVIHSRVDQQRAGLHRVVIRDGETYGYRCADAEIEALARFALAFEGPDASFVYFGAVDEAGHLYGSAGARYREAISDTDARLGSLVRAIEGRVGESGEDWLLAVTTDHGHTPQGGHGGDEEVVRRSFLVLHRFRGTTPAPPGDLAATEIAPLLRDLAVHGVPPG